MKGSKFYPLLFAFLLFPMVCYYYGYQDGKQSQCAKTQSEIEQPKLKGD